MTIHNTNKEIKLSKYKQKILKLFRLGILISQTIFHYIDIGTDYLLLRTAYGIYKYPYAP